MHKLREQFAEIYPPSAPEFLYHFLTLARTAIAEDVRRGRHAYPIGGIMQPDFDAMAGEPFILPGKAIFHDSKEVFKRALGKDWNTNRQDYRQSTASSSVSQQKENTIRMDEEKPKASGTPKPDPSFSNSPQSFEEVPNTHPTQVSKIDDSLPDKNIPSQGIKHPILRPNPRYSPPHDTFA